MTLDAQLQAAYHKLFTSPEGRIVFADLVAYCHCRKTTYDDDLRRHAFKEGQRDVGMRIIEFTCLSVEEIYALRGLTIAQKEDTDG